MPQIVASLHETRSDAALRRDIRLSGGRPGRFYEFEGDLLPLPDARMDFAALGLVFSAMTEGADLHLAGPVSARLLDNLQEFQFHWQDLGKGRLTAIRITAEEEVTTPAPPPRRGDAAVLAFSGGVDATATLIRQQEERAGRWNRKVIGAVMAHGFDIPLAEEARFVRAAALARATLDHFGVPMTVARTDYRAGTSDWVVMHAAGLGSLQHQFRGHAATGMMAYDQHHARFNRNHASNSCVNPLMSGHDFDLRSDAGEMERVEKIALIAAHPAVVANLRVCWLPERDGLPNCGRCEKCVRTRAALEALGAPAPDGLRDPLALRDVLGRSGRARTVNQVDYLRQSAETAAARGHRPPWVRHIGLISAHSMLRLRLRSLRAALRGRQLREI